MPRTFVVPADGPRPPAQARVLHTYPGGAVVVEASGSAVRPGEPVPASGLRLPARTATRSALAAARRAISEVAGRPAPEDEPDIAAYVEFVAPPDPAWLAELSARGLTALGYQPDNAYLVRGRRSVLAEIADAVRTSEDASAVRSVTELTSALKSAPPTVAEAGETVVVVLAGTPAERPRLLDALRNVPGVRLEPGAGNDELDDQRVRVRARTDAVGLDALLALPRVLSVETFGAAVPEDEVASLVLAGSLDAAGHPAGSYDRWLGDHHVDGSGAVIGIVDGGVDVDHPAFSGRARDLAAGRKDWHATMVAGHAAGAYRAEHDPDGFTYGLGTAPAANLLSQDRNRPARDLCAQTVAEAQPALAIQNNSWGRGGGNPMDYGSDEALYDTLVRNASGAGGAPVPLTVCFSSGNSGAAGLTRPKGAKNIIVTGNSENYRPDVGGPDSDDVRDVYTGASPSSHGNCGDGRIRPHVVAPGEWTASASFDVIPGDIEYVSPRITWGGGSSGASPKTAGACALLAQWWRRWHGGADPSPAMLRALVVNGAEPITTGGPIPNNVQGWGRLSLRELLDPDVARIALDQGDVLTRTGETRQWTVRAVDPRRPVKITLAWTDPPASVGSGTATASAVVNRLALRAADGARTWQGTVSGFRDGWSVANAGPGGARPDEGADNLQCIYLRPGEVRSLVVSVTALAITTDALTGGFARPRQDFVLVATNAEVDHVAQPTTVVAGVTGVVASPEAGHLPHALDAAVWWAAGTPSGPPGGSPDAPKDPDPLLETLRTAATTLEAAGNALAVLDAGAGLAGAAAALGDRLTGDGTACAAVLGVRAGTGVTADGVWALRALAGRTDLHLVAEDPGTAARRAAAVGPHPRVRYRLADGPGGLPGALRDAALAAGGLQQVVLGPASVDGAQAVSSFGIIASDGALVLSLPAATTEVAVTRPGEPATVLDPAGPAAGMRLVTHDDRTDLVVDRAGDTPGTWSVRATTEGPAAGTRTAWVSGGADLTVVAPEVTPGRRLLRVEAVPGGLLRQARIPRSRLDPTGAPAPEAGRPLVLRARPSRLSRMRDGGPTPEATEDAPVPALGHVVDLPADAPAVLDVPLDVLGTDPAGTPFARRVNASVVSVAVKAPEPGEEPASGTRQEPLPESGVRGPLLTVVGHIDEVLYRGGAVVGVVVSNGMRAREIVVRSARLGAAIAAMDRDDAVVLGIHGDELERVFRPLRTDHPAHPY
jgi:hypothetical protein